jgi:hypothetical protein
MQLMTVRLPPTQFCRLWHCVLNRGQVHRVQDDRRIVIIRSVDAASMTLPASSGLGKTSDV